MNGSLPNGFPSLQLYCFEDRWNRRVALRPDLAPSLAMMVIRKEKPAPLPLKWFAVGHCWQYERMTRKWTLSLSFVIRFHSLSFVSF
ncbi:unnamed protein product [Linum tenue]|uniref:histidine--tRNA ligase n=1 Tax=Linum tenue TaxID=586396 RepID=A0AAV0R1W7_9ROSI|nr:unnamed protein product [Linum tenue]